MKYKSANMQRAVLTDRNAHECSLHASLHDLVQGAAWDTFISLNTLSVPHRTSRTKSAQGTSSSPTTHRTWIGRAPFIQQSVTLVVHASVLLCQHPLCYGIQYVFSVPDAVFYVNIRCATGSCMSTVCLLDGPSMCSESYCSLKGPVNLGRASRDWSQCTTRNRQKL